MKSISSLRNIQEKMPLYYRGNGAGKTTLVYLDVGWLFGHRSLEILPILNTCSFTVKTVLHNFISSSETKKNIKVSFTIEPDGSAP